MQSATVHPDLLEAARFLELLGRGDEVFTFQTFDESREKNPRLRRILHGSLAEHADTLGSLNGAGAGIFVMVNRGDLRGRSAENVVSVRALFVDLDGAPIEPVLNATRRPDIVVQSSSGKYHAYWLATGCPLEHFSRRQEQLAIKFAGDRAVKDLPRVMRLPGFMHRKGEPFMTHLFRTQG